MPIIWTEFCRYKHMPIKASLNRNKSDDKKKIISKIMTIKCKINAYFDLKNNDYQLQNMRILEKNCNCTSDSKNNTKTQRLS